MTHLIHVGNSLGVRIPKAIITQIGFKKDTNLEFKVVEEGLLISPVRPSRSEWTEAFKKAQKEPLLMTEEIINQFDQEEWKW